MKAHPRSKLNLTTNRYSFPLMLNTTLLLDTKLAVPYTFLMSFGDFQLESLAVLYHVFKFCSQFGCFSQNERSVLLAKILFTTMQK